ncbi:MAG: hypothetical protein FWH18_06470 [Marinilabiliaceae bacterium]|nr:hypothetical protein [Marinilabiliaceae bacterium]
MTQLTINSSEVEQFVLRKFGNKSLTALTTDNIMLLIDRKQYSDIPKKEDAVDKLYGMFNNTSLLSSDDFARNKIFEKEFNNIRICG